MSVLQMAKLDRLQICGIRSFGPRNEDIQDIKFSSPVTLILGENGCGKTTIIEALKYACTGDYPEGTDRGAGFIQEPRLSTSSMTKGFVKLRMIAPQVDKPIVINRGAKVEKQPSGKLKLSKMDCSVNTVSPDGKEVSLSGRCADIGEQISVIMGVSKAIITNVLFCHQEHSVWPLEEDSQVKKKFDEIFDAAKYNKCISDFRKYTAEQERDLKHIVILRDARKRNKELVEKKRADLQKDENNLIELRENIDTKENEIKPLSDEVKKICELENVLGNLRAELKAKETEKVSINDSRLLLLKKIKEEYNGSDCELQEMIENFEKNKNDNTKKIEKILLEIGTIETKFNKINSEIQKAQVRVGQLEAEKKQQQERLNDRNNQINKIAKQLKVIPKTDSDADVKSTITSIDNARNEFEINLNKEREKYQLEEKSQQECIDTYRENIAKLEQEISTNTAQRTDILNQQRGTNSQIKQLDVSDELLRTLNNKIDQFDRQIKFLVESYDSDELERKIKNTTSQIEASDKELVELEKDYSILQKNYVTEENIATRTRDVVKKESKIFELKNSHYQHFKLLFDESPEIDFKDAVEKRIREVSNELDEFKRKIESEKERVTTNETSIRINEQKLNSYVSKVVETNEKVAEIAQGNSFEQVCLELEKNIENLQKERGQYRSAKIIYEKFVKDFQSEKACCPVCETDFNDKKSVAKEIVTKLKSKIEGIPQALEEIEIELKKKQETFNQTQQLTPLYEEAKKLEESSIPTLNSEITEAKDTLRVAQENVKSLNDKLKHPKQLLDTANIVVGDAALLDKYNSEINSYKQEIKNLKLKLVPTNTDKSREQVDRDIKVLKANILEKRKSCDSDTNKLTNNRREYQELREQKSETEKEKFNLEKSMHSKPQLLEQLVALEEKERTLNYEIKRIDQELVPLKQELQNSQRTLNLSKTENQSKYTRNLEEYNQIKASLDNIKKNQEAIDDIANKNIEEQLKTVLDNFKSCKIEEEKLNTNKSALSREMERIKEEQVKAEINKRNLEDNVEIRKKAKDIGSIEKSIEKLEEQIGTYNYSTLQEKKQKLQKQYMLRIKEISNIQGQTEVLEKNITSYKNELELPENKEAYDLYMRTLYQYESKKGAIKDAKIFTQGLEDAIIQFHKEKMSKINATIRDLWRSVYRGNDIDYIQIRTEQPQAKDTSNKRSYNYRVIQIKNDVEIDMRGRCSAGQKVLACLLIRVALALTFSHNCGILALDEPTTNLDKENVYSLCETLGTMIQNRRAEKSFQLIIITHDEDFIKTLSQLENINHCLRVTRNRQGNTVIKTEYLL